MKNIDEELVKQLSNLKDYQEENCNKSKIDIYNLRDIVVEKDTDFFEKMKKSNDDNFIEKDPFLKDVLKNKEDYIERTLYRKEEQIKVALIITEEDNLK